MSMLNVNAECKIQLGKHNQEEKLKMVKRMNALRVVNETELWGITNTHMKSPCSFLPNGLQSS